MQDGRGVRLDRDPVQVGQLVEPQGDHDLDDRGRRRLVTADLDPGAVGPAVVGSVDDRGRDPPDPSGDAAQRLDRRIVVVTLDVAAQRHLLIFAADRSGCSMAEIGGVDGRPRIGNDLLNVRFIDHSLEMHRCSSPRQLPSESSAPAPWVPGSRRSPPRPVTPSCCWTPCPVAPRPRLTGSEPNGTGWSARADSIRRRRLPPAATSRRHPMSPIWPAARWSSRRPSNPWTSNAASSRAWKRSSTIAVCWPPTPPRCRSPRSRPPCGTPDAASACTSSIPHR